VASAERIIKNKQMKLILEFKSKFEHDKYCSDQVALLEKANDGISAPKLTMGAPIGDYTRRKFFTEMELQFIKDNYITKKATWIARQLRRKPPAIYSQISKMYAEGLPRKRGRSGEVSQE
jgi:hypothetical protein